MPAVVWVGARPPAQSPVTVSSPKNNSCNNPAWFMVLAEEQGSFGAFLVAVGWDKVKSPLVQPGLGTRRVIP